jgi:3-carboxy-cis,cis-muconate cycloisomerase
MRSKEILSDLDVDSENMLKNLQMGGGLIMSEAVMMGLAKKIGRNNAHKLVTEAAATAIQENISLREALTRYDEISSELSSDEIESLFDAKNYLGSTDTMIDKVQTKYKNLNL